MEFFSEIDRRIRRGETAHARELVEIAMAGRRHLSSAQQVELARLSRRVGLSELSVQILRRRVRSLGKEVPAATAAEKSEYAAALIAVGATQEGMILLQQVDPEAYPHSLLYQAFGLFTQWDYGAAIPILRKYVESNLSDYDRLVGEVNLAAALVSEEAGPGTDALLRKIEVEARRQALPLLQANALELRSQRKVFAGEWAEARKLLDDSEKALKGGPSLDSFYVLKWRTLTDLMLSKTAGKTVGLDRLRAEAGRIGHLETLRECDLFQAMALGNDALFLRVYVGTPFPEYRKRALRRYRRRVRIPESYLWHGLGPGAETSTVLDLSMTGIQAQGLKPNQLMHRFLLALSSDFYRPRRLASLHAELFPGEWFHPVASPAKLHQLSLRLKKWICKKGMPLHLTPGSGSLQLEAIGPVSIRVYPGHTAALKSTPLDRLIGIARQKPFALREASAWLALPPRTTSRILQKGCVSGALARSFRGRATQYQVSPAGPAIPAPQG